MAALFNLWMRCHSAEPIGVSKWYVAVDGWNLSKADADLLHQRRTRWSREYLTGMEYRVEPGFVNLEPKHIGVS